MYPKYVQIVRIQSVYEKITNIHVNLIKQYVLHILSSHFFQVFSL